jgi:hypothetical protein
MEHLGIGIDHETRSIMIFASTFKNLDSKNKYDRIFNQILNYLEVF